MTTASANKFNLGVFLLLAAIVSPFSVYFIGSTYLSNSPSFDNENLTNQSNSNRPIHGDKIILLWTSYFGDPSWKSHFEALGGGSVISIGNNADGSKRTCTLSTDRAAINKASAVVLHGRDLNFNDLPSYRHPNQLWLFFLLESPKNSGFNDDEWRLANALSFNWTVSYSHNSDVTFPYGSIVFKPRNSNPMMMANNETTSHSIDKFAFNFANRKKDCLWIVSDCRTQSHRERLAARLVYYGLSVDSLGKCSGEVPETQWKRKGERAFFSQYRYFLAMENVFCNDYVSEKVFAKAMKYSEMYGIIPIVYGGANYSRILPANSFIDASKAVTAGTVRHLASQLKRLKQPDEVESVRNFFEWQHHRSTDQRPYQLVGWQNVCEKLWVRANCEDTAEPGADGATNPITNNCRRARDQKPTSPALFDLRRSLDKCQPVV